jgi:hypothetical protein
VIEVAAALLMAASPTGPGCRQPPELARQLSTLAESRWTEWTPKRLRAAWPGGLEAAAYKSRRRWPSSFARRGFVLDGQLLCGEVYDFDVTPQAPPFEDRLKSVTIVHLEPSYEQAASVARVFVEALRIPASAGPYRAFCFDCGDEGTPISAAGWDTDLETHDVRVAVRASDRAFLVDVTWYRRQLESVRRRAAGQQADAADEARRSCR